jgi:hypothetical protein
MTFAIHTSLTAYWKHLFVEDCSSGTSAVAGAYQVQALTTDSWVEVVMEAGRSNGGQTHSIADGVPIQQVVKAAHEELIQLLQQRAEIMKRIGTVKQTIVGLANLFGDSVLSDDLLELIDRKPNGRQPGFTKACRTLLMETRHPMGARDVCAELERRAPSMLARHKDPLASVTTVLNRLVDYGEARTLSNGRGRRVWQWVSESDNGDRDVPARISA